MHVAGTPLALRIQPTVFRYTAHVGQRVRTFTPPKRIGTIVEVHSDGLCSMRVDNSNDGKRSEWCEFLRAGDQVQIVPASHTELLASGPFDVLVGVRRVGDGVAPGAEPVVEAAWQRDESSGQWSRVL